MSRVELSKRGVNLARLTDKQRKFVREYLVSLDGAAAARKAGYAHPSVAAAKLLKNELVRKAIGKAQKEDLDDLKLTREAVIQKLAEIVLRAGIEDQETTYEYDKRGQLIRESTSSSRNEAIALAMKHLGLTDDALLRVEQNIGINWDDMFRRTALAEADCPLERAIETGSIRPLLADARVKPTDESPINVGDSEFDDPADPSYTPPQNSPEPVRYTTQELIEYDEDDLTLPDE